ncbi:MAG: hypothetical protein ACI4S1_15610 [Roseburia sp.]
MDASGDESDAVETLWQQKISKPNKGFVKLMKISLARPFPFLQAYGSNSKSW